MDLWVGGGLYLFVEENGPALVKVESDHHVEHGGALWSHAP